MLVVSTKSCNALIKTGVKDNIKIKVSIFVMFALHLYSLFSNFSQI